MGTTNRKKLKLEVTLAGPTPAALSAAASHFDSADGYRGAHISPPLVDSNQIIACFC